MIGKTLSHYNVTEKIGAGGMGEVYRAKDTKLGRDVAIKVLPEEFSRDKERVARFQREAQLLASLNHPNIAAIHGLDESEGQRFLVLELVEGQTLAERVSRGSVPVDEALTLSVQIAEALEAAHEKGVIHRDLKPANIKITPEGKIKVLDFGLAKAFTGDAGADPAHSPTISMAATGQGTILGTAAYMSPEQARGQEVDKRADIWAFGCVLFEMLSGRQVFAGATMTDIIASVVKVEPNWAVLPQIPSVVRSLLRRCLEKDPIRRLRDIGDARIELSDAIAAEQTTTVAVPVEVKTGVQRKERLLWAHATGVFAIVASILALVLLNQPGPDERSYKYTLGSLENEVGQVQIQLSPDGRNLVRITGDGLWVRPLDELEGRLLSGTAGAAYPFWSPDSRWLGFFAQGKLKKIEIRGGPAQTLSDVAGFSPGGTWNPEGTILFASQLDPFVVYRVSSAGGEPTAVTSLESESVGHLYPQFLPDGRHFTFTSYGGTPGTGWVFVASMDSQEVIPLVPSDFKARYAPPGFLLFERESTLMAQRFDVDALNLDGEAFPIVENLVRNTSNLLAGFSVSDNGQLVYRTGAPQSFQITWFDREGRPEAVGPTGTFEQNPVPALGPSGDRIAFERGIPDDIWLVDLERGTNTRFTFDDAADTYPLFSPDGSQIVFSSARGGNDDIYIKSTSGAGTPELLLDLEDIVRPTDWSLDGRYIVYVRVGEGRNASGFCRYLMIAHQS